MTGWQTVGRPFSVLTLVLMLSSSFSGVQAPDSEAGSRPGGSVGVDVTYPQVNRCEIWNESDGTVDWGSGNDVNVTNTQVDVGPSMDYYIWVNVSHASGISNISNVSVYGWFDNGNSSLESAEGYNATPGKNMNFHLWYNMSTDVASKLWPDSGEMAFRGTESRTFGTSIKEIAFRVNFGNQTRWATGMPHGFNNTTGLNDLFTWNILCDAYDLEGGGADPNGTNEFGTFKLTTLSVAGSPTGNAVPGGGTTLLQVNNPQSVDYSSNAPYTLKVNISDLTGPGGTLQRKYIAIEGEALTAPTFFPQLTGSRFIRGNENNTWEMMMPTLPETPSARRGHGFVEDDESGRLILFGGYDGTYLGDTWAYERSMNLWTRMDPSSGPPPRDLPGMSYDSESDRVILFGGYNGTYLGDTWAYDYDTNKWTSMNTQGAPPARREHAMAYDSGSDRVILFGGYDGTYLGDTWAYDYNTNTWTNMNTQGAPPARRDHAMAYDSESDRVILFGGYDNTYLGDTWAYDYDTNTWTSMNTQGAPPARREHTMAYDLESDRVILFGGSNLNGDHLNDTWTYDHNVKSWTNVTPADSPPGRSMGDIAYDPLSDRAIIFGGWNPSALFFNDAWGLDLNGGRWLILTPPLSPRAMHAMAYDWHERLSISYGGYNGTGYFNETWSYDMSRDLWRYMAPLTSPGARRFHAMAYDASRRKVVMFGGIDPTGALRNDTWIYDTSTNEWTNMSPPAAPSPRLGHAMAYSIFGKFTLLFGGQNVSGLLNDTWAYDLESNTWILLSTNGPSARRFPGMTFDFENNMFILFGGEGSGSTPLDDTWLFDPQAFIWTDAAPPSPRPPPRAGPAMLFDMNSNRTILFGGAGSGYLGDTWLYFTGDNRWLNITKPTRPLARWEAASTYNIQMGRMLLFAGRGSGYMNSTWTFKGTDWVVNLDGVGYTSRPVFWYVSIPFGQAQGSYTSPITYSLVTSVSPVVP